MFSLPYCLTVLYHIFMLYMYLSLISSSKQVSKCVSVTSLFSLIPMLTGFSLAGLKQLAGLGLQK